MITEVADRVQWTENHSSHVRIPSILLNGGTSTSYFPHSHRIPSFQQHEIKTSIKSWRQLTIVAQQFKSRQILERNDDEHKSTNNRMHVPLLMWTKHCFTIFDLNEISIGIIETWHISDTFEVDPSKEPIQRDVHQIELIEFYRTVSISAFSPFAEQISAGYMRIQTRDALLRCYLMSVSKKYNFFSWVIENKSRRCISLFTFHDWFRVSFAIVNSLLSQKFVYVDNELLIYSLTLDHLTLDITNSDENCWLNLV
jgi:hypothetical protein